MAITLGSDPEVMLRHRETGMMVAASGLFGGTKGAALPIPGRGEGYGFQEDNVMLEFNIPACDDAGSFTRTIGRALESIGQMVTDKYPHLEIDTSPCRVFTPELLQHPEARRFGCSADYDGYAQGAKCPGIQMDSLRTPEGEWRFNGGHVHIGFDSKVPLFVAAQLCDAFIALRTIGLDNQTKRRQLYGQAGRYRPTAYGIEYRSLSNFWIFDEGYTYEVGRAAQRVGQILEGDEGAVREMYNHIPWVDVRRAINTEDTQLAADLLAFIDNNDMV